MRKLWMAGLAIGLGFCAGCAAVATPLTGTIYTSVKYPSMASNEAAPGPRRGEATASSILGIVATGDASIAAAARNGGIRKINTADTEGWSLLGLYATYTTVVTGE